MPIYAYRCSNCGHAEDILQKMSDSPLTQCLACGQATYVKQVTAAGFQLKGSGWYVTDFRDGGKKPATSDKPAQATTSDSSPAAASDATPSTAPAASSGAATSPSVPAAAKPTSSTAT